MLDSNNLINKIFKSPSPFPFLLYLPPFLLLLLLLLLLLPPSALSAFYVPSVPSILVLLGRLSCFLRCLPVALSRDIWDVPSLNEESKDKNEDENKGKSKGEDKDKDKDKNKDKDEDEDKDSIPTNRLR